MLTDSFVLIVETKLLRIMKKKIFTKYHLIFQLDDLKLK